MHRDREQRDFARNLRNNPTDAEKRLWWFLRAEKLGCKFRRQTAVGPYIADFLCHSHKLIVELDGPQHLGAQAKVHDARRTAWLASRGFRVLRFRNHELDEGIQLVVASIQKALAEFEALQTPSPTLPEAGREPDMI